MHFGSEPIAYFTIALIGLTCWISYKGFKSSQFLERLIFCPEYILAYKEFYRLVSSVLLHGSVPHLACNMFTLYFFGRDLELVFGPVEFLLIYLVSEVGGSLLSLWLHRNHEYRSYGASGAVCGIVFAHIFLFPGGDMFLFLIPIPIPTWLYAALFVAGSFYGIKRQNDNVGHDAHLGGAIAGLAVTTLIHPHIVTQSPVMFAAIVASSIAILIYLARNPLLLPRATSAAEPVSFQLFKRRPKKFNVDQLLDKISEQGMHSLTTEERTYLESVSDKYRRRSESKKAESELYF